MSPRPQSADDFGIDWGLIYKRLTRFGRCCQLSSPQLSAEDVASETLYKFFASKDRLGWDPKRSSLEVFLFGVYKNVARTQWRVAIRQHGSLEGAGDADEHPRSPFVDPRDDYDRKIAFSELERALRKDSDKHLYALVLLLGVIDCGHNINQQFADHLGLRADQIVNIKKRLQRKAKAFLDSPLPQTQKANEDQDQPQPGKPAARAAGA